MYKKQHPLHIQGGVELKLEIGGLAHVNKEQL
jgi:hypothetical protein